MKLRVCLLIDTVAHNAGAELQVIQTAAHLNRERFEVFVSCLEDSPRLQALAAGGPVQAFPIRSVYTLEGLRQMWRFRRYLQVNKIRILHTYMEKSAIFGVLATLGCRTLVVLTSRLNMGYWYTPFYRGFFRFLDLFTTRIVANSEAVKRVTLEIERQAPDKVDVIRQGVDLSRFEPASPAGESTPVIGIVSNLRAEKDVALFLRAARHVLDQIPEAAFLVIGKGPLRPALGQLAEDLKLADRVTFTDGNGAVSEHLRRLSIGCLTSRGEGFSNAILEYMAAGLPVVATDVGGNREAIVEGQTGNLVRERNPEAFAQPLIKLLQDPELRQSMGRQGRERCRALFDIAITVRQLEDYYITRVGHAG